MPTKFENRTSRLSRLAAFALAALGFSFCREAAKKPTAVGTSFPLTYPVLLIGQGELDVRDSMQALTAVRGHSSLNLNERAILDSEGRLFQVKQATLLPGQRSPLWTMGNSDQLYFVELKKPTRPTWPELQALVLEQIRAERSSWKGDPRAVQKVQELTNVSALIEASREAWNWAR